MLHNQVAHGKASNNKQFVLMLMGPRVSYDVGRSAPLLQAGLYELGSSLYIRLCLLYTQASRYPGWKGSSYPASNFVCSWQWQSTNNFQASSVSWMLVFYWCNMSHMTTPVIKGLEADSKTPVSKSNIPEWENTLLLQRWGKGVTNFTSSLT